MTSSRTTSSGTQSFGSGFTMITGVGGAPVDRSTADQMWRERDREQHDGRTPLSQSVG